MDSLPTLAPADAPVPDARAQERAAARALVAAAAASLRAPGDAPGLEALAAAAGLSPSRFQRLFSAWMGVSPKRYRQHLDGARAFAALREGADVLAASAEAGLSGPGRLHDLMVVFCAASPGEARAGGAGLGVRWGIAPTPLGIAFVAASPRGLMKLSFLDAGTAPAPGATAMGDAAAAPVEAGIGAALDELRADWPAAALRRDDATAAHYAQRLFGAWRGPEPVHVFVKGSQFQLRVWQALLRIPEGALATYGDLAGVLGQPGASRAIGSAVGANPVALLIPCHRVIRASGELGGYRWGEARKRVLLAAELAWQGGDPANAVTE